MLQSTRKTVRVQKLKKPQNEESSFRRHFLLQDDYILLYECEKKGTGDQSGKRFEGKVFVTVHCLCFYGKDASTELKEVIAFSDVIKIEKHKSVEAFQHSIVVICEKEQHLFFSVKDWEETYDCLLYVWQNPSRKDSPKRAIRQRNFQQRFQLSKQERIVTDYRIKYHPATGGGPLEWKLFVGKHFLCFGPDKSYDHTPSPEDIVLSLRAITSIEQGTRGLLVADAIEITTFNQNKYLFTLHRSDRTRSTWKVLTSLWTQIPKKYDENSPDAKKQARNMYKTKENKPLINARAGQQEQALFRLLQPSLPHSEYLIKVWHAIMEDYVSLAGRLWLSPSYLTFISLSTRTTRAIRMANVVRIEKKMGDKLQVITTRGKYVFVIPDHREDSRREIKIAIKLLAKKKRVYGIPLSEVLDLENRKGQIPYLIEASTGYLMANDRLKMKGIFRISGDTMEMDALNEMFEERLNNEVCLNDLSGYAVAANIKLFLRELPSPLVPLSLYEKFKNLAKQSEDIEPSALLALIEQVPNDEQRLLRYLLNFLRLVSQHSSENSMDASNLAIIFTQVIFRSPSSDPVLQLADNVWLTRCMQIMITDPPSDWWAEEKLKLDQHRPPEELPTCSIIRHHQSPLSYSHGGASPSAMSSYSFSSSPNLTLNFQAKKQQPQQANQNSNNPTTPTTPTTDGGGSQSTTPKTPTTPTWKPAASNHFRTASQGDASIRQGRRAKKGRSLPRSLQDSIDTSTASSSSAIQGSGGDSSSKSGSSNYDDSSDDDDDDDSPPTSVIIGSSKRKGSKSLGHSGDSLIRSMSDNSIRGNLSGGSRAVHRKTNRSHFEDMQDSCDSYSFSIGTTSDAASSLMTTSSTSLIVTSPSTPSSLPTSSLLSVSCPIATTTATTTPPTTPTTPTTSFNNTQHPPVVFRTARPTVHSILSNMRKEQEEKEEEKRKGKETEENGTEKESEIGLEEKEKEKEKESEHENENEKEKEEEKEKEREKVRPTRHMTGGLGDTFRRRTTFNPANQNLPATTNNPPRGGSGGPGGKAFLSQSVNNLNLPRPGLSEFVAGVPPSTSGYPAVSFLLSPRSQRMGGGSGPLFTSNHGALSSPRSPDVGRKRINNKQIEIPTPNKSNNK